MEAKAGGGRRERKKREVRNRIAEAAWRLFHEQGIDATTVDQIAEAADVSQKTVFNHFPTKQALVHELAARLLDLHRSALEEERQRTAPVHDQLGAFFARAAETLERGDPLLRELVLDVMRDRAPAGPGARSIAEMQAAFAGMLARGQERGEVRRDVDAQLLAETVAALLTGIIINWVNQSRYPVGRRLETLRELLGDLLRGPGSSGPAGSASA